ncbi:hypothetical protein ACOMHN_010494 [Nucella lapillus]
MDIALEVDLHHVVVIVMVEVAALGAAVVLRAAMVLGAARVFVVMVVRLPEVNEAASYAVVLRTGVVHLQSPAAATVDMVFPTTTHVQREGRSVKSVSKLDTLPGCIPSPQSLNDSSKASDVNSSPEARAHNDTYLDTFTGRTWTCAQTCPAAQTASLSGRL